MPGVITYSGLSEILKRFGGLSSASHVILGLFTNNIQITKGTQKANLVEANFPGYRPVYIMSWSNPVQDGESVYMNGSPVSFEPTSGTHHVWGYYVVHQDGTLIWAELFSSQATLSVGAPLTITPRITLT